MPPPPPPALLSPQQPSSASSPRFGHNYLHLLAIFVASMMFNVTMLFTSGALGHRLGRRRQFFFRLTRALRVLIGVIKSVNYFSRCRRRPCCHCASFTVVINLWLIHFLLLFHSFGRSRHDNHNCNLIIILRGIEANNRFFRMVAPCTIVPVSYMTFI